MSEEEATELGAKLTEISKAAHANLEGARQLLASRSRDAKGEDGHKDQYKSLQSKLADITIRYSKSKKVAKEHEDRYIAKKVVGEAEAMLKEMDEKVQQITDAGA